MNNIRKHLGFFLSIIIAGVAAYFSITGLSKLFAGAIIPVIIMASVLEMGKLMSASYVQRHKKQLGIIKSALLTIFTVALMFITSAGIYGFLTDAYQKTASKFNNIEKQTAIIDKKEFLIKSQIQRNEDLIKSRTEREKSLTNLRTTQETRIDNLLSTNHTTSAKNAQNSINDANGEIKEINLDISKYNSEINVLNDSITVYENQKLALSNSNEVAEVGPLKYIATLTGKPMDTVVNWLILMLIFVFDPLAMILFISAQSIEDEEEGEKTKDKKQKIIQSPNNKSPLDEIVSVQPMKAPDGLGLLSSMDYVFSGDTSLSGDSNIVESTNDKNKEFEEYYQQQTNNINKYRTKFIELIDVLYKDGKVKPGETLLNYIEFKDKVEEVFINKFSIDDIKRFLTVCNYLKITSLNNSERKALVDFETAKQMLETWFNK